MSSFVPPREPAGDPRGHATAQVVLARFLAAFRGRLRAAYVEGSYADESTVTTSDLDLTLIFIGSFQPGEAKRARALAAECAAHAAIDLDIEVVNEASLAREASPALKLGSRLLWGDDIRLSLPLTSLVSWTRDRMHSSYWRLGNLFERPLPLCAPLVYPDPADPFFGYTRRPLRLPDGREVPGTRDLMRAVGWIATALVAYRAGQYVATKRDCAPMYRAHIGDQWSDLVEDVYTRVRGVWQYRIPEQAEGRAYLRAICARTLDFENHFLAIYRDYTLAELRGYDPAGRAWAMDSLQRTPLDDPKVATAIKHARQQ